MVRSFALVFFLDLIRPLLGCGPETQHTSSDVNAESAGAPRTCRWPKDTPTRSVSCVHSRVTSAGRCWPPIRAVRCGGM